MFPVHIVCMLQFYIAVYYKNNFNIINMHKAKLSCIYWTIYVTKKYNNFANHQRSILVALFHLIPVWMINEYSMWCLKWRTWKVGAWSSFNNSSSSLSALSRLCSGISCNLHLRILGTKPIMASEVLALVILEFLFYSSPTYRLLRQEIQHWLIWSNSFNASPSLYPIIW